MNFRPGNKVKLTLILSDVRMYEIMCMVKWVEYDRVALYFPNNKDTLKKFFMEGIEVRAQIRAEKGIYNFKSIIIDSAYSQNFVIELPEEQEKVQRREYLRIPMQLDVDLSYGNRNIKAKSLNLSGGGLRMIYNVNQVDIQMEMGDLWGAVIHHENWPRSVAALGEVIYSVRQGNKITSVLKFVQIEEHERNKIIKLCFDIEASNLKMESKLSKYI